MGLTRWRCGIQSRGSEVEVAVATWSGMWKGDLGGGPFGAGGKLRPWGKQGSQAEREETAVKGERRNQRVEGCSLPGQPDSRARDAGALDEATGGASLRRTRSRAEAQKGPVVFEEAGPQGRQDVGRPHCCWG